MQNTVVVILSVEEIKLSSRVNLAMIVWSSLNFQALRLPRSFMTILATLKLEKLDRIILMELLFRSLGMILLKGVSETLCMGFGPCD